MSTDMLNWLKDYLTTTPTETLQSEWKEIEAQYTSGVNAFDYVSQLAGTYKVCYPPPLGDKLHIFTKLTSNFSRSFFLL